MNAKKFKALIICCTKVEYRTDQVIVSIYSGLLRTYPVEAITFKREVIKRAYSGTTD